MRMQSAMWTGGPILLIEDEPSVIAFLHAALERKGYAVVNAASGAEGLKRMLAQTDMLVVLLPLTETTRGIINASLLSQLNQGGPLGGPILINAGRGGLQVEADILAALDSGALKGASLDVFEHEPLPKDSRLWAHPAVYLSPHNAAISSPKAIAVLVARQIEAYERGEPLAHAVDRRRGY